MRVPDKHCVHGEWMTIAEAARRLGISVNAVYVWRRRHSRADGTPALLEEAWDFYAAVNAGEIARHPGRPQKRHRFRGAWLTTQELARQLGMKPETVCSQISRHHGDAEAWLRGVEHRRKRKAEKQIMQILREAGK